MNSTALISYFVYNSELGLVTQGGKVVWGKEDVMRMMML
jgi:ribosomal protein S8E